MRVRPLLQIILTDSSIHIDPRLDDIFVIEEVSLYEGECEESTYAVAGDILDGVRLHVPIF